MLPGFLKKFSAAIIPFVKTDLTKNSNPIKLKEYLAGGKPVVAVDLDEIKGTSDFVYLAKSYEEFENYLKVCIAEDQSDSVEKGLNFVKKHSWESKFQIIENLLTSLS